MDRKLLERILERPTAPFRESHVYSLLLDELGRAGVPHFFDPIGNLVLGAGSRDEYVAKISSASRSPVMLFIGHTDHPGFHGKKWLPSGALAVQWFGGSPTRNLNGAKVWVADEAGYVGTGKMRRAKLLPSKRALASGEIVLDRAVRESGIRPGSLFGGFAFRSPVWRAGTRWYTKAADDLAGVFCITHLARELYAGRARGEERFLAVLTRAEEVGFIGAIGHFELDWLSARKRPVVCVSLEASRTLPGAAIGSGPVVRLGDRMTVFHPDGVRLLTRLAESRLKGKFQRRIMDGGACEATAATAYGFPAIGISLPLGNYHNQCFEGGPDARGKLGPAPEFVDTRDIEGMLTLCRGLVGDDLSWESPWNTTLEGFRSAYRKMERLLRD